MMAPSRLVLLALVCAPMLASPMRAQQEPPLDFKAVAEGPARTDFRWKTQLIGPRLTFQQRFLVQVRANVTVPGGDRAHDFYFLVKVADEAGHWLKGNDHNHYSVPANLAGENEVQYTCGLYLRPGKYGVTIVAYDGSGKEFDVAHKALEVRGLKKDKLPEIDRDLATVEFVSDVPSDSMEEHAWPTHDDTWTLAHGREWLPVRNIVPVQIDVVLNLSNWMDPRLRGRNSVRLFRQRLGRAMQVGSVLSHLDLAHGCIRISAVDIAPSRVLYDRSDASSFDWTKAEQAISPSDQEVVDVSALEHRKEAAMFFRRFLSHVLYDSGGCTGATGTARKVLIVVGGSYVFPAGAHVSGAWPEKPCDCRYYYLRTDDYPIDDDIDGLMKHVTKRRNHMQDGSKFRDALAQLIADLESGG
ncbi:MAG: hypothetical protein ACRD3E_16965 [Terriglobales bacterium]